MSSKNSITNWVSYLTISLIFIALIVVIAFFTNFWVLTAIPIGFLFGFFLQKGDLCGASAFSEAIMMKDWKKIWGLWICIVTGMAGFAVMDLAGWVVLNPKPLVWANFLIGAIVFGVGMVLAGGCVSGCLFKAGSGNLNSIVAILGIALGIAIVEHGPLNGIFNSMKTLVLKSPDGSSVTIASVTGLPFWAVALIVVVLTLVFAILHRRKQIKSQDAFSIKNKILAKSWKPWQAGLLIGLFLTLLFYCHWGEALLNLV